MAARDQVERDLIVIGGSAGSLPVLQQIVKGLPANLAAAVMVVIHQSHAQPGRLPEILSRSGAMVAEHAVDGEPIELGRIYVAPSDQHLLIEGGRVRLSRGPKENRFRPAIDPLFRTAARAYGPQAIAVILSGLLDDGTLGCMRVKHRGGTVLVQDPQTAEAGDMPSSVMRNVRCDFVLKPVQIAGILTQLVQEPSRFPSVQGASTMSQRNDLPEGKTIVPSETGDTADRGDNALTAGRIPGAPTGLTCPECGGAVWERTEDSLLTYRCHVGHAYTADSMLFAHDSHLEATLWEAVRMFQESASLHRRMEAKAVENGIDDTAIRYGERAGELEARAEQMRRLLLKEE